jgi:hypothetical protein
MYAGAPNDNSGRCNLLRKWSVPQALISIQRRHLMHRYTYEPTAARLGRNGAVGSRQRQTLPDAAVVEAQEEIQDEEAIRRQENEGGIISSTPAIETDRPARPTTIRPKKTSN